MSRPIGGILNVLKPSGMTSFDVVAYIRRRAGVKAGHAGTLDPAAAGVLPVCVGKATRLIEYMSDMTKEYRAEMVLGVETDTQDSTGSIISKRDVKANRKQVIEVLEGLKGITEQIPPMYSALKVSGRKLYELAREGLTVERKARKIQIYKMCVVYIHDNRVVFDVECSKGTYIRTLCHDVGRKLGCGAHMGFLLRRRVGHYLLRDSVTLEKLDSSLKEFILPLDECVKGLDRITVSYKDALSLSNGQKIKINAYKHHTRFVRVYDESGLFLAVGEINKKDAVLKPRKVFNRGDR